MTVWKRYVFGLILKNFFSCLIVFFLLFVLIDYCSHIQIFLENQTLKGHEVFSYYCHQFLKRLDFLLTLSFLSSMIYSLSFVITNNEYLILQSSGISIRQLLSPFLWFSAVCVTLIWINFEYFLNPALKKIETFEQTYLPSSQNRNLAFLKLEDGSKLFYRTWDQQNRNYFDLLWLQNRKNIWKIKILHIDKCPPEGKYVDHIQLTSQDQLEKTDSYSSYIFSEMPRIVQHVSGSWPASYYRLSSLLKLSRDGSLSSYEKIRLVTALYLKFIISFLPVIIVLGLTPFLWKYQRYRPLSIVYICGFISFFAYYLLFDSLSLITEKAFISPFFGLLLPFLVLLIGSCWRFVSITCFFSAYKTSIVRHYLENKDR